MGYAIHTKDSDKIFRRNGILADKRITSSWDILRCFLTVLGQFPIIIKKEEVNTRMNENTK